MPIWRDRTYWRYQFQFKGKRYSKTGFSNQDEAAEEMKKHRESLGSKENLTLSDKYHIEHRVRGIFRTWVKANGVKPPEKCSRCGKPGRIIAHHPDYSKPLEVEWLCRPCHALEHIESLKGPRGPQKNPCGRLARLLLGLPV